MPQLVTPGEQVEFLLLLLTQTSLYRPSSLKLGCSHPTSVPEDRRPSQTWGSASSTRAHQCLQTSKETLTSPDPPDQNPAKAFM